MTYENLPQSASYLAEVYQRQIFLLYQCMASITTLFLMVSVTYFVFYPPSDLITIAQCLTNYQHGWTTTDVQVILEG